jgi:hypothetical protein
MPLAELPSDAVHLLFDEAPVLDGGGFSYRDTNIRSPERACRSLWSTRGKPRLALSPNLQSCPAIGAPQGTPIKTGGTGNDGYEPVPPCREGGVTMPLPPWRGRAYAAGATIALSGGVRGLPARTPGARSLAQEGVRLGKPLLGRRSGMVPRARPPGGLGAASRWFMGNSRRTGPFPCILGWDRLPMKRLEG